MSVFDPATFLDAQVSEVNEKRPPLPTENPASPDGYYVAVIGEVGTKSGTIGKGDRTGQPWLSMTVPLKIEVPQQLQESLKLPPSVTLTDSAFLDLTPEGNLDNAPGRNRSQKAYREAVDKNKPGDVFSWRQLIGSVVKVKVSHELYNNAIVERVAGVFKA